MTTFLLSIALLVFATGAAPPAPARPPIRTESILSVQCDGESLDFRLTDPSGRIAVIRLDDAGSAIPDCDVSKHSWFSDHDDSNWDPDSIDARPYGGGSFSLGDPRPGVWYVDALAVRGCEDSCSAGVLVNSMKHVNLEGHAWLRPGDAVRWRLTLMPLDQREGRQWARLELVRRTKVAKRQGQQE